MHFKKLELSGFKSFAEKTSIVFEPGVTAIVGPNGCGKSNISDSIRWVLGEQSAKSLRGSSMEDVIFSGSAVKEPVNVAEVSLTLSNEDKQFPLDYEEVTISRRLYRSGESEYVLNGNVVRLKDIHQMLMGTGMGTFQYSIIEQGKMDRILNAKPEDRRVIFEEAAGITKFKSQKMEAIRKLEQTDANLLRVNDIVAEVKRQIGSMERQARKAEAYKKDFEHLKNLEINLARHEFLMFNQKREEKEFQVDALRQEQDRYTELSNEVDSRYREKRFELSQIDEQIKQFDMNLLHVNSDARRDQDRLLLNRERVGEIAAKKESLKTQIESSLQRIEQIQQDLEAISQKRQKIQEITQNSEGFFEEAQQRYDQAEQSLGELESSKSQLEAQLQELSTRQSSLSNTLAKSQSKIEALTSRMGRLSDQENALLLEIQEIDKNISAPLFADTQDKRVYEMFEEKVSRFKVWLKEFFSKLLGAADQGVDQSESALDGEVKQFAEDIMRLGGQLKDQQAKLWHYEENKKAAETRLQEILGERAHVQTENLALEQVIMEVQTQAQELEAQKQSIGAQMLELASRLESSHVSRQENLIALTQAKHEFSQASETQTKMDNDEKWFLSSVENEKQRIASFEQEIVANEQKKESYENESVELDANIQRYTQQRDELLLGVDGVKQSRVQAESSLQVIEQEREECSAYLKTSGDKVHAVELQKTQICYEMDRLKDRIFNAYQVDLLVQEQMNQTSEEAMQAMQEQGQSDISMSGEAASSQAEQNWEETRNQISILKEKLAKMGPVNLVAIEEYEELKTRYEFLTKQHDDLIQAKDDLQKAIIKINKTTKEMFAETFEKVRKNFSEYFKILFGGGQAELILLDEHNVLDSGIEIVARPPGKKLQSISLMSGGEKAMTSIAMMFALFKVKPSPFCVLDEIDAPLDESNVDRFCKALKEFITGSQFIIITHNKRTMNLADAMYGITMEKTGISRVVSVKFHDAAESQSEAAVLV